MAVARSAAKGYGSSVNVASRWKLLIAISLGIMFLDQWTKFLVVKHYTPGVAEAHAKTINVRLASRDHQAILLEEVGFLRELSLFYSDVREPCRPRRRLCPDVKVIDGFWSWRYAENKGAAWSLFAGAADKFRRPFLIGVSIAAVIFIISFMRKLEESQGTLIIALSLICGGAIGNLIDRIYLGYVIDFIRWYSGTLAWPTFNIADSAISTGVGLIGLNMILELKAARKGAAKENVAQS